MESPKKKGDANDLGATLPTERVGSPEYFAKVLADCKKGCQRCHECHILDCHDNLHPARTAGLLQAVLDFHELEYRLRAKIARLRELNEGSMAVTRKYQTDAEEWRRRMEVLKQAIEANDKAAREQREE